MMACLFGLLGLTVAWWRLRAAAVSGRWFVVTAAMWWMPLALAPPLASRDVYAYACQGRLFTAGLDPHTVGPVALPCPWLDSVPPIWRDAPSPYGPLSTLVSAAAAGGSGGRLVVAVALLRLVTLAAVALAVWAGHRLARAGGVDPGRAAWLGLAGPLVGLHAVAGAHVDALLTALVLAAFAVAAAAPVRALAAGALWGLAVAVKVTAVLAGPFLLLLLAGPAARVGPGRLGRAAARLVPAALAAYAVPAVLTGHGLGFLNGLGRTDDSTQWTSVPTALGMTVGYALRLFGVDGADQAVLVARAVGVAAGAAAAGVLWVWAWRADGVRTRVWAAGAAFGVAAVLGPVFYPWYALTPLALLAVSTVAERSREWLGVGAAGLSFLVLPNGTGLAPRTKLPGALTVTAATLALARRWLRRRRPVPAGPTTSRGPGS
jgi:hypothetical protein